MRKFFVIIFVASLVLVIGGYIFLEPIPPTENTLVCPASALVCSEKGHVAQSVGPWWSCEYECAPKGKVSINPLRQRFERALYLPIYFLK